jgi:glycosyltransferase involved in cell wall biosynthesis
MGGAETWLMEVLRRWSADRIGQMDFVATGGVPAIFDDEARALGARIFYVRYGRRQLPAFGRAFRRVLEAGHYDALHDHQDYASGWHYLIGRTRLPPVRVTHVHNSYQVRDKYGATLARRATARIGKYLVGRFATHIAGTSRQIIGEYGFDDARFAHVPKAALNCGFDAARFAGDRSAAAAAVRKEFGWRSDMRIALFAGRIDESPFAGHPGNEKNSGFAVDVGLAALARDPGIALVLAGKPSPATPVLRQRAVEAGQGDRIRFAGIRGDIERLMLAADVLLFPSRAEGLGMVAVEAQAAGLPVLAADAVPRECVVVPELVCFRSLAAPVSAWADDLIALSRVPRRVAEANARVRASAFSIEHSVQAMAKLYADGELPGTLAA